MNRSVIKFNPNLPVDVRLDYGPEGKLHERTGDYQYTVNGNSCVMFLPETARNQLLRTHAAKGDLVRICKTVSGRSVTWNVEVLSDAAEPAPGPRIVAPAPARTNGVARGNAPTGGPETNGANALAPQPAQVRGHSHLAQALCLAIDAAIQASEYARSQNFSVTFLGSDIRAMANTVMIQDGGRN
jgi:hypothetical protein